MSVVIYHNPACSTSRKALAAIREAGYEPEVIEYLKTPPDAGKLRELIAAIGIAPRDLIRKKGALYGELGLDDPGLTDEELVAAMEAHPVLIERPIVVTPKGTVLARPLDRLADIL